MVFKKGKISRFDFPCSSVLSYFFVTLFRDTLQLKKLDEATFGKCYIEAAFERLKTLSSS